MRLLGQLLVIILLGFGCSFKFNKENSPELSAGNNSKIADLEIIINANKSVTLPQMDGIEVFLQNNSKQTIKIWEPVNPSGLLEVYFTFDTGENKKFLIEPIVLNWRSDFSKVIEIKPQEKIKVKTEITHWTINDAKLEQTDFNLEGKLKAFYSVKDSFKGSSDLWKGEISSNEVLVDLKHHKFIETK